MSRRLGAVEQICIDAIEEMRGVHKLLVGDRIDWAEYKKRTNVIKIKALDDISKFLGISDEEENDAKEV